MSLRRVSRRFRSLRWVLALATGLAALAAIAIAPAGAAASGAASSPWTQTGGTAGLARVNLTESTLTPTAVEHAKLLRSLATPSGKGFCFDGVPASPVLDGGRVYDTAGNQVNMYNAQTGHRVWSAILDADYDTQIFGVAVGHGLVVAGGTGCDSQSDPNGVLTAFNAATGKVKWLVGDGPIWEVLESGNDVVVSGDSPGDGTVTSVYDVTDGALVWTQSSGECDNSRVIVVHTTVITDVCDPNTNAATLEGESLATGALQWSRPGDWIVLAGSDHSTHGHAYAINPSGAVTDLNAASGATRFTLTGATGVLAVDNTRVYAECGTQTICGYSESTGARLWHVDDPSTLGAEADGVLYLADGKLLNAATGALIVRPWKLTATSLAIGDGRIAVDKPPSDPASTTTQLYGLTGF